MVNTVENYGWSGAVPGSCSYVVPVVLDLLKNIKVRRILDIGAGNGVLCSRLAVAGYKPVGIEYDRNGADLANEKYPDISFYNLGVQDDPDKLLANEEIFDCVVSTEVIEHLYSPHLLPQFAKKVLSDKGYLLIITPYHGYLKNLAISLGDKWDHHHSPMWHGGHIKFWSRKTLTVFLKENGFEVLEFSGQGRFPYLWKSMALLARRKQKEAV
ncbi:class I SAM-dependent methyltransferase [Pontiellaceae bacterium B12227]|nr:class I SAM-dependent methyltransferase [Pontiellaceae bacterium B12227]